MPGAEENDMSDPKLTLHMIRCLMRLHGAGGGGALATQGEHTARALSRRGLIENTGRKERGWPIWCVTDAGRSFVADLERLKGAGNARL